MATVNCIEYANTIASPPVMNNPNTRGKLIRKRFSYTVAAVVATGTVIVLGTLPANARFYGGVWSNDTGFQDTSGTVDIGVTGTAAKFYSAMASAGALDQTPFGVTVALGGGGIYVPTADILLIATTAVGVLITAGTCWGWFDYVHA